MNCLLCTADILPLYKKEDKERGLLTYWRCNGECGLIFLDPTQRISAAKEKKRYDLHNNDSEQEGYTDFLRRLTDILIPLLPAGAHGLDFGSGPEPVLHRIMKEEGFEMENYDPFYDSDETPLNKTYDFITATEVFEHLYDPVEVMGQLQKVLLPGGILAVMTEMVISPERFANWWYHRDPTHVIFYSKETMQWIAVTHKWTVHFPTKNVTLFTKA